jgi:hypothetical protein
MQKAPGAAAVHHGYLTLGGGASVAAPAAGVRDDAAADWRRTRRYGRRVLTPVEDVLRVRLVVERESEDGRAAAEAQRAPAAGPATDAPRRTRPRPRESPTPLSGVLCAMKEKVTLSDKRLKMKLTLGPTASDKKEKEGWLA